MSKRSIDWETPRSYHISIDEHHELSGRYYYFRGAHYFDHQTRLPYYYEKMPIQAAARYNVELRDAEYIDLQGEVSLPDSARHSITDQVQIHTHVSFERSRPYLQIYFVPIRRHPLSGSLQGLQSFNLAVERTGRMQRKDMASAGGGGGEGLTSGASVFRQGRWIKLRVEEEGIHRIDYSLLEDLGMDDPGRLALYGNSSGILNTGNSTTPNYRLEQVPVSIQKGSDGVFNQGDYLLFYGRDPDRWEYSRSKGRFVCKPHSYTGHSYYFLTQVPGGGRRLESLSQPGEDPDEEVTTFPDYRRHEENRHNLIESGQHWYGEYFDVQTSRTVEFDFPNIVQDQPAVVAGRFVSRAAAQSGFSVSGSRGEGIFGVDIDPVSYNFTGYYARKKGGNGTFMPVSDGVQLQVDYRKGTPSAEGWLDYLTVNAARELRMAGHQMVFRHRANSSGNVCRFHLKDAADGLEVWEVTDDRHTRRIGGYTFQDGEIQFAISGDTTYRSFVVFDPEKALSPDLVGEVDRQNLHGMEPKDMLVVTRPAFRAQADELAGLHRRRDGFDVGVVTDEAVYNEFSAGKPDPAAIRNFVRHMYQKSTPGDSLKYLLLFGDGSYDNRNAESSPYLMTYQSEESLHYSRSFVSDDFYGLLDATDNIESNPSGLIDIGIGRLPVQEKSGARQVVGKIERYLDQDNWGPWLNNICFAADDEDNNLHMRDADKLASYVAQNHPRFNIRKVYFDSYQQEITATGARYPGVNREINEQINNGILLFNYTGHGGERQLANERILTRDDIRSWSNADRLPLFMTATCEFTRFDDPHFTSAGEEVFLKEDGGSIASFSTTRLVYASLNYTLNRTFYDYIFKRDQQGRPLRLGDVVRLTKNNAGASNNKRNFSLFGDPALRMLLGRQQVRVDSISPADTLRALDQVVLHGSIRHYDGSPARNFNGTLHLEVYDKSRQRQTLNNDNHGVFQYQVRDNLLFSGKSTTSRGSFTSEWVVPRDILNGVEEGKMVFFARDRNRLAGGSYSGYEVGGFSDRVLNDSQGPAIELYMNDRDFVSGGITNEDPTLLAVMSDSSGINTSRSAVGHNITLTLDNNPQQRYVLNRYYQANENDYQSGQLRYQLSNLEKGQHEAVLKAWDINNNASTTSLEFTVSESDKLKISHVLNYPNPFTEQTAFYFEHNRPGENLEVMIHIMTISGKLVKSIHRQVQSGGFRVGPIHWNGRDDFGDRIGRGVYIYKLKVRSDRGDTAEKIEKLVILK